MIFLWLFTIVFCFNLLGLSSLDIFCGRFSCKRSRSDWNYCIRNSNGGKFKSIFLLDILYLLFSELLAVPTALCRLFCYFFQFLYPIPTVVKSVFFFSPLRRKSPLRIYLLCFKRTYREGVCDKWWSAFRYDPLFFYNDREYKNLRKLMTASVFLMVFSSMRLGTSW